MSPARRIQQKVTVWIPIVAVLLFAFNVWLVEDAAAQFRYDIEYPSIGYTSAVTTDRASRLFTDIEAGRVGLDFVEDSGYLQALLAALEIDPSSQVLVFSKTARKQRFIDPATPRAIYFNDDTYVAFVPGLLQIPNREPVLHSLEVGAMDPQLGPVFFEIEQNQAAEPELERQITACMRCHDSMTNSGGGVPRFFQSSVLAGPDGSIASHETGGITSTATPLSRRWGGWYVTGSHGDQVHMGNFIRRSNVSVRDIDFSETGNLTDLSGFFDTSRYPTPWSDIVALLVMEHQIEVQNAMVSANYRVRTILAEEGSIDAEQLARYSRPLLEALFMSNEAALNGAVQGVSGFSEYFQTLGPEDGMGRSLRELDLESRTFRYPFSYLIYSEAFDALPAVVREYLASHIRAILLDESTAGSDFPYLDTAQRQAIFEILKETKPGFLTSN